MNDRYKASVGNGNSGLLLAGLGGCDTDGDGRPAASTRAPTDVTNRNERMSYVSTITNTPTLSGVMASGQSWASGQQAATAAVYK